MVATRSRPLPGIRFDPISVPPGDNLPRMDVAVFVGFASRGPLNRPRAFEDVAGFESTFGPDRVIAWDTTSGQPVSSWLGPSVRAFFANGGRRCWVVRLPSPRRSAGATTRPPWISITPRLFLDPDLTDVGAGALLAEANYIRYESPRPRHLRGIHAALEVEEATLIVVPDAVHIATRLLSVPPVRTQPVASQEPPGHDGFRACSGHIVGVPAPTAKRFADESDRDKHAVRVSWPSTHGAAHIELEETILTVSGKPVTIRPTIVYSGPVRELVLRARADGTLQYRARFVEDGEPGSWSQPTIVEDAGRKTRLTTAPPGRIAPVTVESTRMDNLRRVQRSLLDICAARGDLFAILALPGHLREREAIRYVELLRGGNTTDPALGFGAIYHPWLVSHAGDSADVWAPMPPDGSICGLVARRSAERGAWIAPANDLLSGVVALSPSLAVSARQDLQDAHINLIRNEPRGYLTLGADTLSNDPDRRPIGVRRLLALLRRLALDQGMRHVFEPNSALFRRRVETDFNTLLGRLFRLGAFAGDSPASSYRVVTDATVNTPQSLDLGRFVVELRVAPSKPLRFMSVRLVHSPDRGPLLDER